MNNVKYFFLSIFIIVSLVANSQGNWIQQGGSSGSDEGYDITIDASGNTYTTGYFTGQSTFNTNVILNSNGVTDIFIQKINTSGVFQWVIKAGGPGPDRANAITTDKSGNIYITGYYQGSATFGNITITSNNSSQDIFIAKYDPSGNVLWAKTAGSTGGDLGNGICTDNSGNVIVTGQFTGAATFDNITLTSMTDPSNGNFSFDIFTAKYDATGKIIWAKQGKAPYTDRGLDVATDKNDNVYVVGQFSDTITFDQVHNNNSYNSVFIVKYNSGGSEQWFKVIGGGTQNIGYGIAVDANSNVLVTGDFKNSVTFFGAPPLTIKPKYSDNVFVAKYNQAGALQWAKYLGSSSPVTSRNIAVDAVGNSYIIGHFKCTFSDLADIYGQGVFNSTGYQDIYIAKFDPTGNRTFSQQLGGQADDWGFGIIVNAKNEPILTGSFSSKIIFPSSSLTGGQYFYGSPSTSNFCGDSRYTSFYGLTTRGSTDVFIANAIDFARQPYDYYKRTGGSCSRPYVPSCINTQDIENSCGSTSVTACGNTNLYAVSNTASQAYYIGSIGPTFSYKWSTGQNSRGINVTSTGTYTATVISSDNCDTSFSSIQVTVNPIATKPTISDSKGVNKNATYPQSLNYCAPDSVVLTGGNYGTNTFGWNGYLSGQDAIKVKSSGYYTFTVNNQYNCPASTGINVTFSANTVTKYPDIGPKIALYNPNTQLPSLSDSVVLCTGKYFQMYIFDSITNPVGRLQNISGVSTSWTITPINGYINGSGVSRYFYPTNSGTYRIDVSVTVTLATANSCGATAVTKTYNLSKDVKIKVNPVPTINNNILGNSVVCQGQSTKIWIQSGNPNYSNQWYGPGILAVSANKDTITVNQAGSYYVVSNYSLNGCPANAKSSNYYNITYKAAPSITMNPSTGLICPTDSVQLVISGGTNYVWKGPSGTLPGNGTVKYVKTPGFYYCVVTDVTGCFLTTNTVEVKQYNTPFIYASPSQNICPGGTATINAATNPGSIIRWQPPLSGSALTQTVSKPGTYICEVTSCGIVTKATIVITQNTNFAKIIASGPTNLCKGDSVILYGSKGMVDYEWNPGKENTDSIVVKKSGTYTVKVTDGNACVVTSPPVIVNISTGVPLLIRDTTICAGQSVKFTVSSTYTVEWHDSLNSVTPLATGLTFTTPALMQTKNYYVKNNDPLCPFLKKFTVFINSVSQPPIVTANSPVCQDSILRLTTPKIPGVTYSWTGPNGFTSTSQNIIIAKPKQSDAGQYSLTLMLNGCVSNPTPVNVIVNKNPSKPIVTGTRNVCAGDSIKLNATSDFGATYTWSGQNSYGSSQASITFPYANTSITGTYVVVATLNGCVSPPDTVNITVDQIPPPPILSTNPVCQDSTLMITTQPVSNITYNWSGPNNFVAQTQNISIPNAQLTHAGNYNLFLSAIGCIGSTSSITAIVNKRPQKPLISGDSIVCSGKNIVLNSTTDPGAVYSWTGPNNFTSNQSSISFSNVSNTLDGEYTVMATLNGCPGPSSKINVVVNKTPAAPVISSSAPVCENYAISFSATAEPNVTFSWYGPNGFTANTDSYTINGITVSQGGQYSCVVDLNGCKSNPSNLDVLVISNPSINLGGSRYICQGEEIFLSIDGPFTSYSWSDGTNNRTNVITQKGKYWVTAKIGPLCEASDSINIIEDCPGTLYVPNSFTPNNDNLNDEFKVRSTDVDKFHIRVYNRWGVLLYESNDIDKGWDGKYLDNEQEVAVYVWKIEYESYYRDEKIKKSLIGRVTLIR